MGKEIYKIISVESRKGGVGKTTAARLLADIVTDTNRNGDGDKIRAVVIDLDILGTDSSEFVETIPGGDIQINKHCLLQCFNEKIICNKLLLEDWKIEKKRIFYIPSLLSSYAKKENLEDKHPIKYTPPLLFDEIHSKWFMDFLKDLFHKFLALNDKDYKLVFILDNPPGYSEFVPVLEDYLVEIGPEIGKTLFVCSLDNQDLKACAKGMRLLHKKYKKALLASKYYHFTLKNDEQDTNKTEELSPPSTTKNADSSNKKPPPSPPPFDKRLFDALLNNELDAKNFYYSDEATPEKCAYYEDPKRCIGLLVNKVPLNLTINPLRPKFKLDAFIQELEELGKNQKYYEYFKSKVMEDYINYNSDLAYQFIINNFDANQVKINIADNKGLRTKIEEYLSGFKQKMKRKHLPQKEGIIQGITLQFDSFSLIDDLENFFKEEGNGKYYILFDPKYKFSFAGLRLFSNSMSLVPDFLKIKEIKEDEFILLDKRLREAAERKVLDLGKKIANDSSQHEHIEEIYEQCIAPIKDAYKSPNNVLASIVLALPLKILKDILSENAGVFYSGDDFAATAFDYIREWLHEFTSELIRMRSKNGTIKDKAILRKNFLSTFFNPELLTEKDRIVLDEILNIKNEINLMRRRCVQAVSYLLLRYLDMESDLEFFMNSCYNLKIPDIDKDSLYLISKSIDQVVVEKTHNQEEGKKFLQSIGIAYMADTDSKDDVSSADTIDYSFIDNATVDLKNALAKIWHDWS